MFAPVIQDARSDSRNATTSATSGSEPRRPNGNWPARKAAKSSGLARWKLSQPPPGNMIDPGLFFFSRRRRHTSFDCDWSSDVCSSDLEGWTTALRQELIKECGVTGRLEMREMDILVLKPSEMQAQGFKPSNKMPNGRAMIKNPGRSEERRVGKERTSGRPQEDRTKHLA